MTTLLEQETILLKHLYQCIVQNNQHFSSHTSVSNANCRVPPLHDMPTSKSYRLPNNLFIIIPKERRNKKRILENDRDISPFSIYYQH